MRKLIIPLLFVLAFVSPAKSQESPYSLSVYYSFCQKDYAFVGMNRLTTIEELFGRKDWKVDISAFVGPSRNGRTLAGFAATVPFKVAKDLYFIGGLGVDGDFTDLTNLKFEDVGFGVSIGLNYIVRF